MSAPLTGPRTEEAIWNITTETGYPPTPEELADALGVTTKQIHSSLLGAKRAGRIGYDEAGCLVYRSPLSAGTDETEKT